jgi:hypothetical protein
MAGTEVMPVQIVELTRARWFGGTRARLSLPVITASVPSEPQISLARLNGGRGKEKAALDETIQIAALQRRQ